MKLHAILNWYDESPTWLGACVTSLTRLGVDHLVAIDGRYPHFNPSGSVNSEIDQHDAIISNAHAAGIQITMHTIDRPMLEPDKRTRAFRLLEASATPFDDWVLVIDADESIVDGNHTVRDELRMIDPDTHVASCRIASTVDPYAEPSPDNDVNERTLKIHQGLPTPQTYVHLQSRFWRVLRDMRSETTHFNYTGIAADGERWNVRPDLGVQNLPGMKRSDIHQLQNGPLIAHRKNQRTFHRQALKRDYYSTRDELGIERTA